MLLPVHVQRVLDFVLQRPDFVPLGQQILLEAQDLLAHLLGLLTAAAQGNLDKIYILC